MSQSNDSQPFDVFISHSSKDFAQADALCQAFEARGVKCWIAPRDIPAGADFAYSIDLAIQAAPVMVLLFSTHADTSEHVITEVDLAMDAKATILPVRIENTLPKMLNYRLRRRQWTDAFAGDFKDHVAYVVDRLKLVLKHGASPAATAPQEVQAMDEVLSNALPSEKGAPLGAEISPEIAHDGRPPFELVWQAFVKKVGSSRKWLLPGLGYSQYRVSFTPKGSARGENVGGAGTIYSAPKRTVEQVWVEVGQGVDVTNKVVRDIIGNSAHTGFIGSIVEELRRLEAELEPGATPETKPIVASSAAKTPAVAHDVYISHSSKDFAQANALCQALEAQGVKCWIAPRDIPSGADFANSIDLAIQAAPVMVLLFSSNADNSEHVVTEVEMAMDAKATILPVRIENVLPKALNYQLRRRQWTDAYEGAFENHVAHVARQVAQILKSTTTSTGSTPVAPPPPVLTTFERLWKAFADKVRSDSDWLLPGLGASQFVVSFTSPDDVSGVLANFGGEPRVTSKAVVQKAWEQLEPDVRASNPVLIEILGAEAHTNLIGAIIEELRRLEATPPADTFEEAWQKFVQQVESQPQRLLNSTGASQFRVSMAPRGGVLGVNVNGNAELPYSASKPSIEQVWKELKPQVHASPTAVQGILGRGAHFGLIAAIVEEMRRLQAAPSEETASTWTFEDAWQKLVRRVENEPSRLLDTEIAQYRLSLSSRGNVLGNDASGKTITQYTASKPNVEKVLASLKPGKVATAEAVDKILNYGEYPCTFIGAVIEEMRRLQKSA